MLGLSNIKEKNNRECRLKCDIKYNVIYTTDHVCTCEESNDTSELESMTKPSVMVSLHCLTDTELLWLHGKIWLLWEEGMIGLCLNNTITSPDP